MSHITSLNSIVHDGLCQFAPVKHQDEGVPLYFLGKHAQIIFLTFYRKVFVTQVVKVSGFF